MLGLAPENAAEIDQVQIDHIVIWSALLSVRGDLAELPSVPYIFTVPSNSVIQQATGAQLEVESMGRGRDHRCRYLPRRPPQ